MAAARKLPIRLALFLALVPVAWGLLDYSGALGRLNNVAMDSLFLFRGQKVALDRTQPGNPPLKVAYADIDSITVDWLGERPWPRDVYADLITDILQYGHARAVGLDFFLSPAGLKSKVVDKEKAREGNEFMSRVMINYPQAVIAAIYSNVQRKTSLDDIRLDGDTATTKAPISSPSLDKQASFPYIYQGHTDPKKNAYPESPSYPLIGLNYGTVGLIDVATLYSVNGAPDNVPRWIPLFADTEGPDHTLNLIWGILDSAPLQPDHTSAIPKDNIMLINGEYLIVDNRDVDHPVKLPEIQKKTFYNLSFELALQSLGLDHTDVRRSDDALIVAGKDGKPILDIPLTEKQLIEINWFSKWFNEELNPRISAQSVLVNAEFLRNGTPEEKAKAAKIFEMFNGAIVLIGPTDETLQDLAPTPFDSRAVPKVGVYGNLLKTFFSGEFIRRPPPWVNVLALFVLTGLVGGLAVYSGHRAGLAKLGAVLILGGYILGVYETFASVTFVLPLVAPVASALTTAFLGGVMRLLEEEKQKKRIKGMFGAYISPELVHRMVESGEEPKLGGEQLTISIFFSDVQGFSGFSEVLSPERLVELMNEYLTAMTDILQAESGTLDKYIGDAVVAMFGAPIHVHDNAIRACIAACRMQKRLGELRQKWINEGAKWPSLVHKMRTRIGLNTGQAVVGNMGSTSRFNYTMMGDDVNLGARLESGAKQFGVYTMCAEATMLAADKIEKTVLFRRLNKIIVKGRSTPVDVFEVVCMRTEATPDILRCVELFEKGIECYFSQKWDEAGQLFAEAEKLEPLQPGRDAGVEHNPSELMQKACRKMKENPPPADWNGVLEMKEK